VGGGGKKGGSDSRGIPENRNAIGLGVRGGNRPGSQGEKGDNCVNIQRGGGCGLSLIRTMGKRVGGGTGMLKKNVP